MLCVLFVISFVPALLRSIDAAVELRHFLGPGAVSPEATTVGGDGVGIALSVCAARRVSRLLSVIRPKEGSLLTVAAGR